MAEFNDDEFNVKKQYVLGMYDRISKHLMTGFAQKYKEHKDMGHQWFIQGTIHSICRALLMDKQVAIYLILGFNPRRPGWGNLKEKYDIEPLKFVLRREVVAQGRKLEKDMGFKVFFTDLKSNGDFHMKVIYYKHGEEPEGVAKSTPEDTERAKLIKDVLKLKRNKELIFREVLRQTIRGQRTAETEKREIAMHEIQAEIDKIEATINGKKSPETKPTTARINTYAAAAYRGKDKPAPKPIEDKKVVKPASPVSMASDESIKPAETYEDSDSVCSDCTATHTRCML